MYVSLALLISLSSPGRAPRRPQSYTFLHVYSSTERAIIIDRFFSLCPPRVTAMRGLSEKNNGNSLTYDLLYGLPVSGVSERAFLDGMGKRNNRISKHIIFRGGPMRIFSLIAVALLSKHLYARCTETAMIETCFGSHRPHGLYVCCCIRMLVYVCVRVFFHDFLGFFIRPSLDSVNGKLVCQAIDHHRD